MVATFPDRAIDFYGAMRARIYDEQIREFIYKVGIDRVSSSVVNPADSKVPTFPKPQFTLARLVEFGRILVQEQELLESSQLVSEYNKFRYGETVREPESMPIETNHSIDPLPAENDWSQYQW